MTNKILVTYASRSGATAKVADVIGKTLIDCGANVEVNSVQDVHSLKFYDAVVIGSAIRIDSWLPEAMQFIQQNQVELSQMPVATFLTCMALGLSTGEQHEKAKQKAHQQWMRPVRELVNPVDEGLFGGALNINKIPELRYRVVFRLPVMLGLVKEGDYQNWDIIRQWASDLPAKLIQ